MPSPVPAVIPAKKARIQFGALIDQAFYQDAQFVIVKKNKPLAVIVGTPAWERMQKARGLKARRMTFKSYRMGRMKGGLTREELYADARPRLA